MVKLVLAVTGLLLLSVGLQDLYFLSRARQQSTVTCEQFVRDRPRDVWLRVTGCEIDYLAAGFRESGGSVTELLFPVRPGGHPRTEPAVLVVATRDPEALRIAQQTIGNGREPDQEQFLVMMLRIVTALRASREVDGMTRTGVLERVRARRLLSGLSTPVAPGAVLMDLHARPRARRPAALTAAGALALVVAAVLAYRRKRAAAPPVADADLNRGAASPSPPAAPEAIAPPAIAAASSSAPRVRVLLLALPPDAGAGAIEHAPPLGELEGVRATIARNVSGLRFDAENRGAVADPDHAMSIELGHGEVVHTAVVDARGARAVAELRSLLAETGWRAYAPQTGAFLDADRLDGLPAAS